MSFRCVFGKDVTPGMIKEAIEIDNIVYPIEYRGDYDTCLSWLEKNPDIYTMLLDNDRVIGYINAMPTREYSFNYLNEIIKEGGVEIIPEEIFSYDDPRVFGIYICSIAILPSYQDTKAIDFLLGKFFMRLSEILGDKVNSLTFLAQVISEDGEKFCNRLGLIEIKDCGNMKLYGG